MALRSGNFHHHPFKGGILGSGHEILRHCYSFPAMLPGQQKRPMSHRNTALINDFAYALLPYIALTSLVKSEQQKSRSIGL
jgi:hypothetical protein